MQSLHLNCMVKAKAAEIGRVHVNVDEKWRVSIVTTLVILFHLVPQLQTN